MASHLRIVYIVTKKINTVWFEYNYNITNKNKQTCGHLRVI